MCWAVPVQLISIEGNLGTVDIDNVRKKVCLDLIDDPREGDYVLLHAGYAIQKVEPDKAEFTKKFFKGELDG